MAKTSVLKSAGTSIVAICVGFVLSGAVYFGIASCGGYVWHKEFFRASTVLLYVSALVLPSAPLASFKKKALFAAGLPLAYALLESAIAPFYPGPPDSLGDYGELFLSSLEFGPCQ
jgi:hypothetical protein